LNFGFVGRAVNLLGLARYLPISLRPHFLPNPQPHLNSAIAFAALFGVVGSDRKFGADPCDEVWGEAAGDRMFCDNPGSIAGEFEIGCSGPLAVGKAEKHELAIAQTQIAE
jgi:hypothetical protein